MPARFTLLARLTVAGGYRPSMSVGGADARPDSIYRGKSFWVLPGGRAMPCRGTTQHSANAVGTRIYALDQYRGEIGGGLVSSRLPKESLVRYLSSALFFVSENTSQQVYINELTTTGAGGPYTLTGVTTSGTAGKLRVALLSGAIYTAYDAGIAPPASIGTVAIEAGGSKSMDGIVSIRASARRITTDTTSNPTDASVQTLAAAGSNRIRVTLPALGSGTDGWIYSGTSWGQGNFGPWKVIREVRGTIAGTSTTDGSTTLTGSDTRFRRDLRAGDKITRNAVDLTISSITSDTVAILTAGAAADATARTMTMKEIVLDWRNDELGEPIEFDNDLPPLLDGVLNFNNVLFGWKDNTFYAAKIGNPEGWPAALGRSTQSGGNIVGALAGDTRIYLLTTNGLEVVTFTQNPDEPFLIRQAWGFGFSSPAQAVIVDGVLYAVVGTTSGTKAIRTRVDDSPDLDFGVAVETDMLGWDIGRVTMAHDPRRAAVLFCHYDATASESAILPFMLQQQVWSTPQFVTPNRQILSATTANNSCYFIVSSGGNTVYGFENDASAPNGYLAWPFVDAEGIRQIVKRIKFSGKMGTLRVYASTPGAATPDVTNTGAAIAGPFTLSNTLEHEPQIQTNVVNAQSFSVRVDTVSASTSDVVIECCLYGLLNMITR